MEMMQSCPYCHAQIPAGSYFCSNCGKSFGNKPLSVSISKQVAAYAVSIFLTPLGLWWAYKYFRQGNTTARNIGVTIIVLTVASLAINVWVATALYGKYTDLVNQLTIPNF